MFCQKCGKPLAEDAQFCSSCGVEVQFGSETPTIEIDDKINKAIATALF